MRLFTAWLPLHRLPRPTTLLASLLLALCVGTPAPARATIAVVLNSGEATISILDQASFQEIRRFPVLREPHHLVLTPDRSELVVGDSGGNELLFLDPATGELKRRVRLSNPYHLAYSPDGTKLVVTSLRRDQVDVYDAATLALLRRFPMHDMPSHLAFSPDSRRVFITLQGTRDIAAIDLERLELVFRAQVGPQPAGIAWTPANMLLVGIMGRDHVAVVNPDDGQLVRTVATGRGAHAVFPSPDGKLFYVTNRVGNTITVIDGTSLEVVRTLNAPGGADCIDFSLDGRFLWFTKRWAQRVGVIDLQSGEVVQSIPVGRSPHGIYVHAPR